MIEPIPNLPILYKHRIIKMKYDPYHKPCIYSLLQGFLHPILRLHHRSTQACAPVCMKYPIMEYDDRNLDEYSIESNLNIKKYCSLYPKRAMFKP
jgi:hypothetical protein